MKALIIGLALLALGACSAVRLGYNNGPGLTLWWLDRWLDLNDAQEAAARPALERWFAWHRATQLPVYADRLAEWRRRAAGPLTGGQVCVLSDELRQRLWTALEAGLPEAAAWLPTLGEAQWQYLAQRQAERLADLREEFLQPDPAERLQARLARGIERAEEFYGPLTADQRTMLAAAAQDQAFDPAAWLAGRAARQQALLRGLREAQAEPDTARRVAALREAARAYWLPAAGPDPERDTQVEARACEITARLHNSATPAQREHLKERLDAWEEDLRALAAQAAS